MSFSANKKVYRKVVFLFKNSRLVSLARDLHSKISKDSLTRETLLLYFLLMMIIFSEKMISSTKLWLLKRMQWMVLNNRVSSYSIVSFCYFCWEITIPLLGHYLCYFSSLLVLLYFVVVSLLCHEDDDDDDDLHTRLRLMMMLCLPYFAEKMFCYTSWLHSVIDCCLWRCSLW